MAFDKAYFDAGICRVGTECEKWDGMIAATGDESMIPMWVADMDFPSPPAVREALASVLARGTWGYTISGDADKQALAAYWARRHNTVIDPESVTLSPCVVTGLKLGLRAVTKEGDGILINPPVYGPFFMSIRANGRKVVESPLVADENGRYTMNFAEMEEKLASGEAKAIMLCSPHNPVGRAWSREELTAVVALCRKYNAGLICDEIHADFVFAPGKHVSILEIEGAREFAVMLCAASKTFNVAGLEQSSIVCENEEIRTAIRNDMDASGIKAGNCFALAATRAAYTDCDEWLDGLKDYLMGNYTAAVEYMATNMPKVKVSPLEATYLMWLDCRALGLTHEELLARIADAHVKTSEGLFFGEMGRCFIRLNIGCPRSQLMAALERLKTVLG